MELERMNKYKMNRKMIQIDLNDRLDRTSRNESWIQFTLVPHHHHHYHHHHYYYHHYHYHYHYHYHHHYHHPVVGMFRHTA
jgi:hypothetical protein